jgi:hypothetical protein
MLQAFALAAALATVSPVLVNDPVALEEAERRGASLPQAFGAFDADASNRTLQAGSAAYRKIAASLAAELEALLAGDPQLATGMARAHRLFDGRWLRSSAARFELVAVVNRMDRAPFARAAGIGGVCGELRLIYRLAYATRRDGVAMSSRLPLTVNVVYWQRERDCAALARRWLGVEGKRGKELGSWLVGEGGPASAEARHPARLKSIEINMQSVRWPSTTRADLGAHAEYFLRVFDAQGQPQPLENTPDVARLQQDPALKRELAQWTLANLPAIDAGVAVMPERFLARRATSVSPHGLARLANRPVSRLFGERDFAGADLARYATIKTPAALLRRLDDSSCVGCHQARTVAGFHVLGVDRAGTAAVNAVAVTGSPHLALDLERRERYVRAVAAGKTPDDTRPLSERAAEGEGGYGSHCGRGDPGFATWTCKSGLVCRASDNAAGDSTVGQCLPAGNQGEVGDPCEVGVMRPHADPRRDRIVGAARRPCRAGVCEASAVGFPAGMCAVSCGMDPDVGCGAIAVLADFNACLGRRRPFTDCLEKHVRPAGLRRCDEQTPCRDDYLCARGQDGSGVCIPPYFLFQLRVDGHPHPPPS